MQTFGAAPHEEILQLVVQLAVLLGTARVCGFVARRLGQPSVVGEILAGVLLGPSVLSGLFPFVERWIIPQTATQGHLLEVVGLIGVMFLLVVTGLETDLALIRRRFGTAVGISAGGLSVTFLAGLALGYAIPEDLLGDPTRRGTFALFVATALAITAIPVLAKVLLELGLMRRNIGQTMLASAMIDDLTGWTLLGLVTGLASAEALEAGTVVETIAAVAVFGVASATIGRWIVTRSLGAVMLRSRGRDGTLTLIVVLAFAWGAFSQALHLEPIIGAFVVGILFGRLPYLHSDAVQKLESITLAVFAPIFFATAGLKVDVGAILEPRLLLLTVIVVAVATAGKVVGAYAGARLIARQDHWSALAYGAGLNARGALEIIVASIGLSLGILTVEMYSIIVVMAIITSVAAPVALRACMARVEPAPEEERRLEREAALEATFVAGIRRVLVPVRPRPDLSGTQTIEAYIAARLSHERHVMTTLLAVTAAGDREEASEYLRRLGRVFRGAATRIVVGDDPIDLILDEARNDYDLLMLGTPAVAQEEPGLFGRLLDEVVKDSPCPAIVVRGHSVQSGWKPSRILVPVSGTQSSRDALDLALSIAEGDTEVVAVHVVTPSRIGIRSDVADDITGELEKVADALDRPLTTRLVDASDVESGILETVQGGAFDLLVLSTRVRAGTTRLHLGPRVESLVSSAPCPVVVLNS